MSVGRICVREVYLADANESVVAAARRMKQQNVGTLVVLDEDSEELVFVITQGQIDNRRLLWRRLPRITSRICVPRAKNTRI